MLIFVPRVFLAHGFRLHRNNSVLLEAGILTASFTNKLTQTSRESKVILPKITGRARNCKSWFWFCALATIRFCHLFQHMQVMRRIIFMITELFWCVFFHAFVNKLLFILSRSYCQCWFMLLYLNINLHCLKIMLCTWLFMILNYEHRKSI